MDEKTVFHLMEKMTFSELLDEDFDPFEADLEKKAAELQVTVDYLGIGFPVIPISVSSFFLAISKYLF